MRDIAALMVGLVLLGTPFLWLREALYTFYQGSNEAWFRGSSFTVAMLRGGSVPVEWLTFALGMLALGPWIRWTRFPTGRELRWLAGALAFVLAWPICTHEYNYYFDQLHVFDRLLVATLAIGVVFTPACIPALLVSGMLAISQLAHPLGPASTSLTDRRLAIELLLAFAAWLPIQATLIVARDRFRPRALDDRVLIVALLCIVGASYVGPGLEKIGIAPNGHEWVTDNDLSMLAQRGVSRGWMAGLSTASQDSILAGLQWASPALLAAALLTEISGIVLLWRRGLSVVLLVGFAVLHGLIFLSYGLFFWKWMLADLALAALLLRLPAQRVAAVFRPSVFVISLTAIATAPLHLAPIRLGWFDSPTDVRFEIELETEDGRRWSAPPSVMAPYEMTFSRDKFEYLLDAPFVLANKNYKMLQVLRAAGPKGVSELHRKLGKPTLDLDGIRAFDLLVQTFFENRNQGLRNDDGLRWLRAPPHVMSFQPRGPNAYAGNGGPIRVFRLWRIESYYRDRQAFETSRRLAREVRIPAPVRPAAP